VESWVFYVHYFTLTISLAVAKLYG
jgi:hypothetical protein